MATRRRFGGVGLWYTQRMKNLLALLADIANGLFAALAAGWVTDVELVWWHFLIGILLAMCPDLDAVPELLRRGRVSAGAEYDHDHRDGLHYPIVFVLFGVMASYFLPFWGSMFLVAITLHFVNDLYGTGWGIKLLWPLSNRNYKLLGRRANLLKQLLQEKGIWDGLPEAERRLRLMVSWSPQEMPRYIQKYGLDHWIESYYLNLNWISVIEYLLFLIALSLTSTALL